MKERGTLSRGDPGDQPPRFLPSSHVPISVLTHDECKDRIYNDSRRINQLEALVHKMLKKSERQDLFLDTSRMPDYRGCGR
jgi:hypothetical protein